MKKALLLLMITFACNEINAQNLFHKFIYATKASRVSYSYPEFVFTKDNDYLQTQSWPKRINDTLKTIYEILKLDVSGNIKAEKGIILNSASHIYSCADGNLLIYGQTSNQVTLAKAAPSGRVIWSRVLNDGSFVFSAGGVILNGNTIFIGGDNYDLNTDRYWDYAGLLKVDYLSGKVISYDSYAPQTFTPDSTQLISGLLANSDGSFIMYGISNYKSPFLMKFNATGSLLWAKYYTLNNLFADLNGIVQTTDGGYAICGDVRDEAFRLHPVAFKVNTNGNVLWCKNYTSQYATADGNEYFDRILCLPTGSLYVSGEVWHQTKYDNVLVKLDNSGNIIWSKRDSIFYITSFTSFAYNKNTNLITGCGKAYIDSVAPSSSTKLITFDTAGNNCNGMAAISFTKTNYPYTSGNYPLLKTPYTNIVSSNNPLTTYELGYTIFDECISTISKTIIPKQQFNFTLLSNIVSRNQIDIKIKSEVETKSYIIVKGLYGQVFTNQPLFITKGITVTNINQPMMISGYYVIQIMNAMETHSQKFYNRARML